MNKNIEQIKNLEIDDLTFESYQILPIFAEKKYLQREITVFNQEMRDWNKRDNEITNRLFPIADEINKNFSGMIITKKRKKQMFCNDSYAKIDINYVKRLMFKINHIVVYLNNQKQHLLDLQSRQQELLNMNQKCVDENREISDFMKNGMLYLASIHHHSDLLGMFLTFQTFGDYLNNGMIVNTANLKSVEKIKEFLLRIEKKEFKFITSSPKFKFYPVELFPYPMAGFF